MALALSEEYSRDYFIKAAEPSWLQVLMLRLMAPFYLPMMVSRLMTMRADENFITKGKRERMNGDMNCTATKELQFVDIKGMSKKLGVTINDVVTCAISASIKQLFEENGDKSKEIQIAIPANIRFKFYESRQKVKLENKFTAISIKMPLCPDMEGAYSQVVKMTRELKKMFVLTYTQYILTYLSQLVTPNFLSGLLLDDLSSKYTLAFSNTPGAMKPLYFLNKKGEKVSLLWSYTSMVTPGFMGLYVNAQSCCDSFRVCVTSDNGLVSEAMNTRIAELIEINIEKEKERTKSMPLPEAKKEK